MIIQLGVNFSSQQTDELFDERDVERLRVDDGYIRRFLKHCHNSQEKALVMIKETIKWRKDNDVNGD